MRSALALARSLACLACPAARADLIFNDGQVHTLTMRVNDNVQVFDGPSSPTSLIISPAVFDLGRLFLQTLSVHDHSSALLTGINPLLTSALIADGHASLTIFNAESARLSASGDALVTVRSLNLHGGTFSVSGNAHADVFGIFSPGGSTSIVVFSTSGDGTITLYGTDFNVGYGPLPFDSGEVSGMVAGGPGGTQHFLVTTGGRNITLAPPQSVPEPASVTLLAAGAICLAIHCRLLSPAR